MVANFLAKSAAPVATGVNINNFSCDKYVIIYKKKKQIDYWCADPAALPISPQDYQTSKTLLDIMLYLIEDMLPEIGLTSATVKSHPLYSKFPVLSIEYSKRGKPESLTRLLEIRPQNFSPDTFNIPTEYKRTNLLQSLNDLVASFTKKTQNPSTPTMVKPVAP